MIIKKEAQSSSFILFDSLVHDTVWHQDFNAGRIKTVYFIKKNEKFNLVIQFGL